MTGSTQALVTAESWAAQVAETTLLSASTTIGFSHGTRGVGRSANICSLADQVSRALYGYRRDVAMLALRLEVVHSQSLAQPPDQADTPPQPVVSPWGPWWEVQVRVPVGEYASWSLLRLPRWLPYWKSRFDLILVDLGPINEVPSRTIGRLCDRWYVLLGPATSPAFEWLHHHITWHQRAGCPVSGTLLMTSPPSPFA